MRNRSYRLLGGILAALLAGCGNVSGVYPRVGSTIPSASLQLTDSLNIPLSSIAAAGAIAAVAYVVLDPLAPNWDIQETKLGNDQYRLSMRLKRFAGGGTGEARQSFLRRAVHLAQEGGYGGYQVVSFSEGVEFAYPASQRVSEGVIQLLAKNSN